MTPKSTFFNTKITKYPYPKSWVFYSGIGYRVIPEGGFVTGIGYQVFTRTRAKNLGYRVWVRTRVHNPGDDVAEEELNVVATVEME